MKSPLAKFGLLILAAVLSYFPASYIGHWYDNITPQTGNFITGVNQAIFFAGWLLAFGFFVMFLYGLFGIKENKNWITVLLILPTFLWLSSDLYHIYIPTLFGLAGFILAWLLRLIYSKLHRPNPPMVVK